MSRKSIRSSTALAFVRNLKTLGFDSKIHCNNTKMIVDEQTFTLHPNSIKAFEFISHFLFQLLDDKKTSSIFRDIWPVKNISQSQEYRRRAFQWLKDMQPGSPLMDVPLRKSYFNDCRGEPLNKIFLVFTIYVLDRQRSDSNKRNKSKKLAT